VSLKSAVKQIVPPVVLRGLHKIRGNRGIAFEGDYPDWESALQHASGYDAADILERVRVATHKVVRGEVAGERDSVLFDEVPYPFPLISVLLRAAMENKGQLNVLDFGGALGSSYYQCRNFLEQVSLLCWCVVEQPEFVKCGNLEFQTDELRFFDDIESANEFAVPNVVLLSGVLQYLPDPMEVLERLIAGNAEYIVIDRTPISMDGKQHVSIQKVPSTIYRASYPLWLFNEEKLKRSFKESYQQIAEFDAIDGILGEGTLKAAFKGYLLQKK